LMFLYVVLAGYIAGVLHKTFYHMDGVIIFYIINLSLVIADTILFYRNLWIEKKAGGR
jgi:phage-related holin